MAGTEKLKSFCTLRKDEAAFYLNELAKGLLRNRVTVPVNDCCGLMTVFEAFRLDLKVGEREDRCQVDIRLSWSKPLQDVAMGTADRDRGEKMEDAMMRKVE